MVWPDTASSSITWSMRPSSTATLDTPFSRARTQLLSLGTMPPWMRPLSSSSLASEAVREEMAVLALRLSIRMPSTSVRKTSLSAFSASATAQAASSALQL